MQAKVKTMSSVKQVALRAISVLSSEEHFEADRGVEFMKCDYRAQGQRC